MGVLIQIVATYAPYIYLVCGLVALYQLYRLVQVRADRRQAVFSLERERAMRELYAIFSVALILVLVMGATYFANTLAPQAAGVAAAPEPTLPAQFSLSIVPTDTPLPMTPSPTPTFTVTPTPLAATPDATALAQATLTPNATPQAQATPTPPPAPAPVAALPAACADPRAAITSPGNGATVGGVFTLVGTATHEAFSFFKVEFAPGADASSGFTYLADGRGPVFGGALASVDTRGFSNGPWTFQLTVVDQTGNYPDPCRVTVNVQN